MLTNGNDFRCLQGSPRVRARGDLAGLLAPPQAATPAEVFSRGAVARWHCHVTALALRLRARVMKAGFVVRSNTTERDAPLVCLGNTAKVLSGAPLCPTRYVPCSCTVWDRSEWGRRREGAEEAERVPGPVPSLQGRACLPPVLRRALASGGVLQHPCIHCPAQVEGPCSPQASPGQIRSPHSCFPRPLNPSSFLARFQHQFSPLVCSEWSRTVAPPWTSQGTPSKNFLTYGEAPCAPQRTRR